MGRMKLKRIKKEPGNGPTQVDPQILVRQTGNQVRVNCNFQDWDMAISMLIDALRAAQSQKLAEKKQSVVLAKPQIILATS